MNLDTATRLWALNAAHQRLRDAEDRGDQEAYNRASWEYGAALAWVYGHNIEVVWERGQARLAKEK